MAELLHFIPIIICLAFPATFVITYIWAVLNKHVYPLLPNISDTGSLPPESCLFSMMLNLTAALLLFSLYIRHKEVIVILRAKNIVDTAPFTPLLNRIATIFGLVACVALDITANFQVTNVFAVHGLGAIICFVCSAVYILLQAVLTFMIVPHINSIIMVIIRALLGVCVVIFTISSIVTDTIALKQFSSAPVNHSQILHWTPDLPGWKLHVTASICEWILVITLALFILSLYWDFRKISLTEPELVMYAEPQPLPVQAKSFKNLNAIIS
ncbi:hypothetical protein O3M35_010529 [Rhynocoris fuscipes]|uniref:CWH43-like N-terminal domain-containing protein n=1 Tax=Rhynocoris fuscipes TaxID=488301 RepID=A0AAW1D1J8_9HEMI